MTDSHSYKLLEIPSSTLTEPLRFKRGQNVLAVERRIKFIWKSLAALE